MSDEEQDEAVEEMRDPSQYIVALAREAQAEVLAEAAYGMMVDITSDSSMIDLLLDVEWADLMHLVGRLKEELT